MMETCRFQVVIRGGNVISSLSLRTPVLSRQICAHQLPMPAGRLHAHEAKAHGAIQCSFRELKDSVWMHKSECIEEYRVWSKEDAVGLSGLKLTLILPLSEVYLRRLYV